MNQQNQLENYLARLDKALGNIAISDRADIITEIKSHILESTENNPQQELSSVLNALGEPESVANRYLLERGLKIGKPAKSPMVKWLTIGFLGTISIVLVFSLILVWKFSPIIKVDEENEHVTILGGLIDVNGKAGSVNIGASTITNNTRGFVGNKQIMEDKQTIVNLTFKNGKILAQTSLDRQLSWNCSGNTPGELIESGETINLDFEKAANANCQLQIPTNVQLIIKGVNGKLHFDRPHFPIDVKLTNGSIDFTPDINQNYNYDVKTVNGMTDIFKSSDEANALPIIIKLVNGKINKVE